MGGRGWRLRRVEAKSVGGPGGVEYPERGDQERGRPDQWTLPLGQPCVRPVCVPLGCDVTWGQAGPGAAEGGSRVAAGGLPAIKSLLLIL